MTAGSPRSVQTPTGIYPRSVRSTPAVNISWASPSPEAAAATDTESALAVAARETALKAARPVFMAPSSVVLRGSLRRDQRATAATASASLVGSATVVFATPARCAVPSTVRVREAPSDIRSLAARRIAASACGSRGLPGLAAAFSPVA